MYRGVTLDGRTRRWYAVIVVNKIPYDLGLHDTPEEAGAAYDVKARELLGQFATLNFSEVYDERSTPQSPLAECSC